jgi:hypothetical protein
MAAITARTASGNAEEGEEERRRNYQCGNFCVMLLILDKTLLIPS